MKYKLTIALMAMGVSLLAWSAMAFNNPHITEVDLDIEGVDDGLEFGTASEPGGPGGFVESNGWKKITLSYTAENPPTKLRLNWNSDKIKVFTATNGGTEIANGILWEPASDMPSTLYVKGVAASDSGPTATTCGPEHMCLEAINNGSPYLYDRIGFTVLKVGNISVSAPDMFSINKTAISIKATATCGGSPVIGVTVTFSSSDLTFPSGNTAVTDGNGVATVTADAGSTPSSCLDGSSVTASADNGAGTLVTGNDQFSIVRINDPTPANPKILDGHYPDNSLYTVVLTNTVTPAIAGVPLTYEFKFGSGESNGVDYPATTEDASSTTDSSGSATVRVRSSDLRQTVTVKCIYQESYGSTGVTFEGITGCPMQE